MSRDIIVDSAAAMQSAAKAPYLLMFEVERWDGPDSAVERIELSMKENNDIVIKSRPRACRMFYMNDHSIHMMIQHTIKLLNGYLFFRAFGE